MTTFHEVREKLLTDEGTDKRNYPNLGELLRQVASEQGLDFDKLQLNQLDTLPIKNGEPLTHRFVIGNRVVEILTREMYDDIFGETDFAIGFYNTANEFGHPCGLLKNDGSPYVIYSADDDPNAFARQLAWKVLANDLGFDIFEPEDLNFLAMVEGLEPTPSPYFLDNQSVTYRYSQYGVCLEIFNPQLMSKPAATSAFREVAANNKMILCDSQLGMAVFYKEPNSKEEGSWFAKAVSDKIT